MYSTYYDKAAMANAIERGEHREVVGGLWEEIGGLQLAFLQSNGLIPSSTLLDIGCGSLRLGARAVDYLSPARYWGTDLNSALMEAGYEREIVPAGLAGKLPRAQLIVDEEFTFTGVPTTVDYAIATSVFTHLPLKYVNLCLARLAQHLTSPCTFFFSIFVPPDGLPATETHRQSPGGIVTHPNRDPYHFTVPELRLAAAKTPWALTFIGDWDHPRNQMMVKAETR